VAVTDKPKTISMRHARFGAEVRRRRIEMGWTQEDLAFRAGMSTTYVGQAERGQRNITLTAAWAISDALAASASSMLAAAEPEVGPGSTANALAR
jgi:transcriptional regulator with XRE-family HTH domain